MDVVLFKLSQPDIYFVYGVVEHLDLRIMNAYVQVVF